MKIFLSSICKINPMYMQLENDIHNSHISKNNINKVLTKAMRFISFTINSIGVVTGLVTETKSRKNWDNFSHVKIYLSFTVNQFTFIHVFNNTFVQKI